MQVSGERKFIAGTICCLFLLNIGVLQACHDLVVRSVPPRCSPLPQSVTLPQRQISVVLSDCEKPPESGGVLEPESVIYSPIDSDQTEEWALDAPAEVTVAPLLENFQDGDRGCLRLTQHVLQPDGSQKTVVSTVMGKKETDWHKHDEDLKSTPQHIFSYMLGKELKTFTQEDAPIPYQIAPSKRQVMPETLDFQSRTVKLAVERTYTRPDDSIYAIAEETPPLPAIDLSLTYQNTDATLQSKECFDYKILHEGTVLEGKHEGALIPYAPLSPRITAARVDQSNQRVTLAVTRRYQRGAL